MSNPDAETRIRNRDVQYILVLTEVTYSVSQGGKEEEKKEKRKVKGKRERGKGKRGKGKRKNPIKKEE